jgi:hypothetical protein
VACAMLGHEACHPTAKIFLDVARDNRGGTSHYIQVSFIAELGMETSEFCYLERFFLTKFVSFIRSFLARNRIIL